MQKSHHILNHLNIQKFIRMNIQIGTLVSAPNYNNIQMKPASYPCRDIVHKDLRDRVCTQGCRGWGRRGYEKVKVLATIL